MNKQVALALWSKAQEVATHYSNPDRDRNQGAETFTVESARPTSEHVALVTYLKSSGKRALALFYYIPAKERWEYLFPTDSHLLGLEGIGKAKARIEAQNFEHNFSA